MSKLILPPDYDAPQATKAENPTLPEQPKVPTPIITEVDRTHATVLIQHLINAPNPVSQAFLLGERANFENPQLVPFFLQLLNIFLREFGNIIFPSDRQLFLNTALQNIQTYIRDQQLAKQAKIQNLNFPPLDATTTNTVLGILKLTAESLPTNVIQLAFEAQDEKKQTELPAPTSK